MKSDKGVTLISLIIYVMSFLAIAGVVALVSSFFYNNSKVLSSEATASSEFDMLNAYFTKETREVENYIVQLQDDDETVEGIEKKIVFSNGNKYIFIKENETEEYGKIIFSNEYIYFILSDYVENLDLPQIEELKGVIDNLDELKINVKILGKEYTQNYKVEK